MAGDGSDLPFDIEESVGADHCCTERADGVALSREDEGDFRGLWTGVARCELLEATEGGRGFPVCSRMTGDVEVAEIFAVLKARGGVEDKELDALCNTFPVFRGVIDSEAGKIVFRIARRGRGLIGRSTVTYSSSASSSELLTSTAFSWAFSSVISPSQLLSRFLVIDPATPNDSVLDLSLYFGKADGGRLGLGCKAEDRPRNVNEARGLDGVSTAFFGGFSPTGEVAMVCERVVGFEGAFMSFGVDLSFLLLLLVVSSEGRAARLPSRMVAMTGFALAAALDLTGEPVLPVSSHSVLEDAAVESLSLFITSARALPTERVIVKESRFGREGRVGEVT